MAISALTFIMNKSNKLILFSCFLLIVLGAGSLAYYFWSESKLAPPMKDLSDGVFPNVFATRNPELQKELKRLYDEKCLPKQLMAAKPKIPDDQNAATLLRELWRSEALKKLSDATCEVNIEFRKINFIEHFRNVDKDGQKQKLINSFIKADKTIKENQKFLKNLDTALQKKYCYFNLDYTQGHLLEQSQSHLIQLRAIARIQSMLALWTMAKGKKNLTLQSIKNIFKTAEAIRDEPLPLSRLVYIALKSTGLLTVKAICNDTDDKIFLAQLKPIIEKELAFPALKPVLKGETILVLSTFESENGMDGITGAGHERSIGNAIKALTGAKFKKAGRTLSNWSKHFRYSPEPDLLWILKNNREAQKSIDLPWGELQKKKFPTPNPKYLVSCLFAPPLQTA